MDTEKILETLSDMGCAEKDICFMKKMYEEVENPDDPDHPIIQFVGTTNETYRDNNYYQIYETRFDPATNQIVLQKTLNYACKNAYEDGYFWFTEEDEYPYLRVLDVDSTFVKVEENDW